MRATSFVLLTSFVSPLVWAATSAEQAFKQCEHARGTREQVHAACDPALKSEGLSPRFRARAHLIRGNAFSNEGDLQSAMSEYEKAIHVDPTYGMAYNNRGTLWNKVGSTAKL